MQQKEKACRCILLVISGVLMGLMWLLALGPRPVLGAPLHQTTTTTYLPLVVKNYDPGWQWQLPSQIALSPHPNHATILVIDRFGRPHILWDTYTSPRYIYHTYLTEQGWTAAAPVAESLGTSETLFPPIIDSDGNLHLLWHNWLGSSVENPYCLLYAVFDGSQWSAEEEVVRSVTDIQGMVQLDGQDGVRVTYVGTLFFGGKAYQTQRISGVWSSPVQVNVSHIVSLVWPDMAGGIHFYGNDTYNNILYHSYWLNGQFIVDGQTGTGQISGRQTQLDIQNNLHVYWTGQVPVPGDTVTGIYYQCLDASLNWSPQIIPSEQEEIAGSPSKAWDGQGGFALAWKETPANRIRLSLWGSCTQGDVKTFPFASDINWEVAAAAISHTPRQACVLARELYTYEYTVVCAVITGD